MVNPQDLDRLVVSTRQVRRVLERRRGARRGIVLIFVVVLLMLLAIMGTAYLAASRADRTAVVSRGSLGEAQGPPTLIEANQFDTVVRAVPDAVMMPLIEDLFNLEPGTLPKYIDTLNGQNTLPALANLRTNLRTELQNRFRQEKATPKVSEIIDGWRESEWNANIAAGARFENYDAPGLADPWLASQFPVDQAPGNPLIGPFVWPWISAPLRGETFLPPQFPPPSGADFSPLSPTARQVTRSLQLAPFFADPRLLTRGTFNNANNFPAGFSPYDREMVTGFSSHFAYQKETAVGNPIGLYVNDLNDLEISAVPMLATDMTADVENKTTRLYPGLEVDSAVSTAAPAAFDNTYIAADTDGDGMADGGLMPVILNPDAVGVDRFIDAKNSVVYFVGYRIVDNSARINMNTALTAVGDVNTLSPGTANGTTRAKLVNGVAFTTGEPITNVIDGANLGFFRSNVGLAELIQMQLETFGDAPNSPRDLELQRLFDVRLPLLKSTALAAGQGPNIVRFAVPNDPVNNPAAAVQASAWFDLANRNYGAIKPAITGSGTLFEKFEYRSLGDLLEQQIARRPDSPGGLRWWSSAAGATPTIDTSALVSLPVTDALSLSARGGALLNDKVTPGQGESALLMGTRLTAPNFNTGSQPTWKWFPLSADGTSSAGAVNLWYEWTQNYSFDSATNFTNLLDEPNPNLRRYDFVGAAAQMANVPLVRSLRPLVTTVSGATNVVPTRRDGEAAYIGGVPANTAVTVAGNNFTLPGELPGGMPYYAQSDADRAAGLPLLYDVYPAIRAAAATSTKEQLFRAYWSVMTQNDTIVDDQGTVPLTDDELVSTWKAERNPARSWNGDPLPLQYWQMDSFDAFLPPDRHASAAVPDPVAVPPVPTATPRERLDENQMSLIRAAIAAANTVDLRDSDNDMTAMTVDLGFVNKNNTGDKLYARVYGTEKQLVISAVVIDVPTEPGVGDEFVALELFNPSDEPLDLRGYYLSVVDRGLTSGNTLDSGTVTTTNPGVAPVSLVSMLPATITTLEPGGFIIITNTGYASPAGTAGNNVTAIPGHPAVRVASSSYKDLSTDASVSVDRTSPLQVTFSALPQLFLLDLIDADRELLLMRTRRADGVAYTEDAADLADSYYPRPAFTEVLATAGEVLRTLVPVDGVDFRQLTYQNINDTGTLHWYMRNTFNPRSTTPSLNAWKCFYAGPFFDVRPGRTAASVVSRQPSAPTNPQVPATDNFPWMTFPIDFNAPTGGGGTRDEAVGDLGRYRPALAAVVPAPPPTTTSPVPHLAPTIPIQKFRPWSRFYPSPISRNGSGNYVASTVATDQDFAPNKYPFGSPFARNGDVLAVPFIGSYKIFRQEVAIGGTAPDITVTINTAAPPELYEAVPLTMDAVNVAPVSGDFVSNPSVGRFDARADGTIIDPTLQNTWAADLFDFVTARQSSAEQLNFPDLPPSKVTSTNATTVYNDPLDPLTDQDGPVRGEDTTSPVNNDEQSLNTMWVNWRIDNAASGQFAPRSASRGGATVSTQPKSQLIQGLININTAPFVVLRMLPWTVDATEAGGGRLDQRPGAPMNVEQRARTGLVMDAITTEQAKTAAFGPFGVTSLFRLAEVPQLSSTDPALTTYATVTDRMRFGQMNPFGRPDNLNDFESHHANVTRISNLASQRSDAYTVYVTVQAWTWVGDTRDSLGNPLNQFNDTRLVGERRMTFVVDRSLVSGTNFTPAALIKYLAEDE